MRSVAPRDSSTSFPQLSQTRMVFRAIPRSLRSGERCANSPRSEKAQCGLLFGIEAEIAGADDPQMPRPEIVDRPSVEILLDDGWADVRRSGDRRRVSEPLRDMAHHCRNSPLCLGGILRRTVLRELDRGEQRAAPRSEVLCRVVLAQVGLHIGVEFSLVEVSARAVAGLVLEQPRTG